MKFSTNLCTEKEINMQLVHSAPSLKSVSKGKQLKSDHSSVGIFLKHHLGYVILVLAFMIVVGMSLAYESLFLEELMIVGGIVFALLFYRLVKMMDQLLNETI